VTQPVSRVVDEFGVPRTHVMAAPEWTNPFIGMVALISAAYHAFGPAAEQVSKEALYRLGLRTGEFMLEQRMIAKDCSPTEWGRFTLDLMDLTGFHDHEEIDADATRFEFRLTAYPYLDPYRYLDAPRDVCDIPVWWDRGCLAVINAKIRITKTKCFWWGDGECRWVHELMPEPQDPFSERVT
jgi:hypothetical protein